MDKQYPTIVAVKIQIIDVYNADETGMYYRVTPDSSFCYYRETFGNSKKAMQRMTVLCCSNMTGTDECKLLVLATNGSGNHQ